MTPEPTVFVVDDDPAVLDSISSVLRSQGLRDECFRSADAFRKQVDMGRAGCLVVDLRMPGMSAIQLLRQLADDGDFRPAVVITGYAEVDAAVQSMKLGAIDFLQKPFAPQRLLEAVGQALEHDRRLRSRESVRRRIDALSDEERRVLTGITRGLTNREIADELDLSLRTVQSRRSSLVTVLGVDSKAEIIALVQQANWPAG